MNVIRFEDLVAQGRAQGQRVFIRADLNVPLDATAASITEDTRIRASIPCIELALKAGAAVMVTSHLGRPTEGAFKPEDSLAPGGAAPERADGPRGAAGRRLGRRCEPSRRARWCCSRTAVSTKVKRRTRRRLARKMAALCDIFVHDAFGTAHRAEASTYGIAQYAKVACAGPLLAAEIDAINQALANPKRPLVAIVAGSKVSTKLSILQSLAKNVDQLIVGGGIANTFMLAAGLPIGKSLAEASLVEEAKAVIAAMQARGAAVPIPTDVVTAKEFKADAPATVKAAADVAADDLILDIGPDTARRLADQLMAAGTIVWNGPVGVFEFDGVRGRHRGDRARDRAVARVQHRRWRRHARGDRQVRHRGPGRLHLHRRWRVPRGAGGPDPAGVRDPGKARGRRITVIPARRGAIDPQRAL